MTSGRVRLLALGLLLLAFVAGALGGIAADRLIAGREESAAPPPAREAARRDARPMGPGRPGAGPGAIFPRGLLLGRELDLTPEQRRQVEEILRDERLKADSVMRSVRPVLQARYDTAASAVREVLTPEQQARWDSLREERRGASGRRPR